MSARGLVVVGASMGGVQALQDLLACLPPAFPAPVLVVMHLRRSYAAHLDVVLSRWSALPVAFARDRNALSPGTVLLAPPNRNMTVEDGIARVLDSPREGFNRPSINALFRSAAQDRGPFVSGVLLSGLGEDGTAGCWEIRRRGGVTLVQLPAEASQPAMPMAAIEAGVADHRLRVRDIAAFLMHRHGASAPAAAAD